MKILFLVLALAVNLSSNRAHAFAVATGTPEATEAAIEILKRGGNAVDAAIAAAFALNASQPANTGIGGGGFFLAKDRSGKLSLWNSRETAPASAHEKMFLDQNGKPLTHYPDAVTGPNPVGVPGFALGLWEAHKKLGSLPWKTLLQPAIRIAREGHPISQGYEQMLAGEWPRLKDFPTSVAIFGDGNGSHLKAGRIIRNPMLAKTLETIAKKGAPAFYRGALADTWVSEAQKLGVRITKDDLKGYKVEAVAPVEYKALGLRFATMAPPSAAGLTVGGTLRFLEHYYKTHERPAADSAKRIIVTTEALKYFQELRNKTIADRSHAKLDPAKWLGSPAEKTAWKEIEKQIEERLSKIETAVVINEKDVADKLFAKRLATLALFSGVEKKAKPQVHERGHTAHLSVIDDKGMAVSYTSTIEEIFGSAMVVTGHGFLLNNELSDFTKTPGHANSPAPGKRPRSNMSPHLIFDQRGNLLGAIGCAGGQRIPTMIVLALENYLMHKMGGREAVAFTRFHPSGDALLVERTLSENTIRQLKEAGYDVEVKEVYGYPEALGGTLQALLRRSAADKWEAVTEPRADGMAIAL